MSFVVAETPVEVYAFVHAALGEGYTLDVVLAHEGLDLPTWATVDEAWADAIGQSLDGDMVLSDAYDAELMKAQDRFSRSVEPLDSDYAAYLRFTRLWSSHEAPLEYLASVGLRYIDMVRLQRRWGAQLVEDDSLRRQSATIMSEPETITSGAILVSAPRPLGDVRPPTARPAARAAASAVSPPKPALLAPLPHGAARAQAPEHAEAPTEESAQETADMTVDQYGELQAYIAWFGVEDNSPVFERFGIRAESIAEIDRKFSQRFVQDGTLILRFNHAYDLAYNVLRKR